MVKVEYFLDMIWIPWEMCIPDNPKEALEYIKRHREPAINKVIRAMENDPSYFKAGDLELPQ